MGHPVWSPAASAAEVGGTIGRGEGVVLGVLAEAGANGVVVDVVAVCEEVFAVSHTAVSEASLPDRKFGTKAAGEAALQELHGALECDVFECEKDMDVVGHDDEGVEFVMAFAAVVLEGVEEELGVRFGLEEAKTVPGATGDEICAVVWSSVGDRHGLAKRTSGAKAPR